MLTLKFLKFTTFEIALLLSGHSNLYFFQEYPYIEYPENSFFCLPVLINSLDLANIC